MDFAISWTLFWFYIVIALFARTPALDAGEHEPERVDDGVDGHGNKNGDTEREGAT